MNQRAPKSPELELRKVAESLIMADILSFGTADEEYLDPRLREEDRALVLRHAPEVASRFPDGFKWKPEVSFLLAGARHKWNLSRRPTPDVRRKVAALKACAKAADALELALSDLDDAGLRRTVFDTDRPTLRRYGLDPENFGLSDKGSINRLDEKRRLEQWALWRRVEWAATDGVHLLRWRVAELAELLDFRSPRTSPFLRACLWKLAELWWFATGQTPSYSLNKDAVDPPPTTRFEEFVADAVPGVLPPDWREKKPRVLRDVVDLFRSKAARDGQAVPIELAEKADEIRRAEGWGCLVDHPSRYTSLLELQAQRRQRS
jgi:hypothetical protein